MIHRAQYQLEKIPPNTRGVVLALGATRTRFVASRVRISGEQPAEPLKEESLELTFLLPRDIGPGDQPQLELDYFGEFPVPLFPPKRWISRDEAMQPGFGASALDVTAFQHRREAFLGRLRAIHREPNAKRRRQMLGFFRLDQRSDDQFLEIHDPAAAELIRTAASALAHRAFERGSGVPNPPLELPDAQIVALGKLFRRLLETDFPTCEALSEAFDAFARGELAAMRHSLSSSALFVTHGVPNGTYFFSFAEAALEFARRDPSDEYWTEAFRTFVRGAEMFLELYWGGGSRCRSKISDEPSYAAVHRGDRVFDNQRLARLRKTYSKPSLDRLERMYTGIVMFAYRDSKALISLLSQGHRSMIDQAVFMQTLLDIGDSKYEKPAVEPPEIKEILDRIRANLKFVPRQHDRGVSNALLNTRFSKYYGLYRAETDKVKIDVAEHHDSRWDSSIGKWVDAEPGMYYPTDLKGPNGKHYFVGIEYVESENQSEGATA